MKAPWLYVPHILSTVWNAGVSGNLVDSMQRSTSLRDLPVVQFYYPKWGSVESSQKEPLARHWVIFAVIFPLAHAEIMLLNSEIRCIMVPSGKVVDIVPQKWASLLFKTLILLESASICNALILGITSVVLSSFLLLYEEVVVTLHHLSPTFSPMIQESRYASLYLSWFLNE